MSFAYRVLRSRAIPKMAMAGISGTARRCVWVLALAVVASLLVIVYLAISLLEKLVRKQPEAPNSSAAVNEFANDVPDVRIADDAVVLNLFEITKECDRLIPLLEAGKLQAWGRLGNGNPPLTKILADQWTTHYLDHRPAESPGRINQTFFRPRSRPYESTYYDVYLNRGQLKRAWPSLWESTSSLVDAESIRLAGIVGALMEATLSWSFKLPLPAEDIWIKRYNELKDSAHPIWPDSRVRQLRIEFMHYCGIVGKPLGNARETVADRNMLDRYGRQLISLLKGEQSEEGGDELPSPRIPCTELLKIAAAAGWDFTSQNSVHLIDLQDAMRQGGADSALTIWGRANKWTSEELMRNELLERIPPDHWKEYFIDLICLTQGDNFHTKSWKPERSTARVGYVDLHVDGAQATSWLRRDALSFKGRRP